MHAWMDEAELIDRYVIDAGVLQQIMPTCDDVERWVDPLNRYLDLYGLDSDHEIAMFLAHIGHESADMTRLEESLWYSADRLRVVWPHRFPSREASLRYAGNPEALANNVYGDRLGNTAPGDGWKFRGRGLIQLTGRDNYQRCSASTGLDLIEDPDLLVDSCEAAVDAALWFWQAHVTGNDMKTTTRQVNGGYHGLEDRIGRYHRARAALEG